MEQSNAARRGFTLLYVEDEPDTREIIGRAIASDYPDLSLYSAADGAEGLELFKRHRPELVITDIRMPVMDGIRMAGEIKAIAPEVEIIALTAYSDTSFLMSAIEVGFNHYVLKPLDLARLFAAIDKSIKILGLKRQVKQQNERLSRLAMELEQRVDELQESEQRFRATFNQAAVGIGHIAPDGSFLRINGKYCDIVGCSPEEMRFLNIKDFTHPEDRERCMEYQQLLLDGTIDSYSIEKRYLHKDNMIVWVSLTASLVSDAAGAPEFIVGVVEDITARKQAEEALRRSELKLSRIFHCVPALIAITTLAEGKCIDINDAGLRLLGYEREELIGRSLLELGVWADPSLRQHVVRLLEEQGMARDLEVIFRRKNGSQVIVLFSAEMIEFDDNRYLLSIVTDITQRKQMAEEIAHLNKDLAQRATELESTNRELETFSYTVAHDLRKPLTVINGYCQVIRELCGDKLDPECTRYLQDSYEGTLRMNRLIDSLLNFSRAAHAVLKREMVDLSAMVEEVAAELKLAEPGRKVIFRIAGGVSAEGDANLLRIVIANLLGNAWKYTSELDEAIIEFGAQELDGRRAFFVRDNGIGLNMAEAADLFTPFRRLPSGERIGGLGIGLATVERIINRHGGNVWAEGEPGKGAAFYFTI